MAKSLGSLLKERRLARNLIQEEVSAVLGVTRQRYGQIENGSSSITIPPDRATKLCRLLEIDMLDLVIAMGYPIRLPGVDRTEDVTLLKAFHEANRETQEFVRRGLEL
jgi:transcriptional regulator with XRE-family HTH domain